MVRELAPQDRSGSYTRPANAFNERIGSPRFPVRALFNIVEFGLELNWLLTCTF
jgi:hypothetical protein